MRVVAAAPQPKDLVVGINDEMIGTDSLADDRAWRIREQVESARRVVDITTPDKRAEVFDMQTREIVGVARKLGIATEYAMRAWRAELFRGYAVNKECLAVVELGAHAIDHAIDEAVDQTPTSAPAASDSVPSLDEWEVGDDNDLPPSRQWLLGNQFCRRFLSGLLAPGSTGKSALRLVQYILLATNRPLTGQRVFKRSGVLVVSLEDDKDELRRRIAAVCIEHKVTRSELKGWLFCAAPKGFKLAEVRKGSRQIGMLEKMRYQSRGKEPVCQA